MPLQRQVISWPLTGGIDTKNSPLMIQPGSHIQLDNVRQERTNEWRARNGTNRSALDDMPQSLPPLMVAPLGAGLVALTAAPAVASPVRSSVATYSSASATARWSRLDTGSSFVGARLTSPMEISRRTVFPAWSGTDLFSHASSGATAMTVSQYVTLLTTLADGIAIGDGAASSGTSISAISQRRRVVFGATYYVVVTSTVSSGNVNVSRYSESGALIGTTLIGTDSITFSPNMLDAIKYPGASTITIVYRNNAGGIRFIEYNDTTDVKATDTTVAQDATNCLSLLPDPDSSGVRFLAVSSTVPETRVLRCTSAGAVTTNELIETGTVATQIAGCAYQAGASYSLAWQTAGGIKLAKKRSGGISTPSLLSDARLFVTSNAWRETGDDQMRFIYSFHGVSGDAQDSYFIAAVSFDQAATNDTTLFSAQAKMLPLEAGPQQSVSGTLPQVVRIAARSVEIPLPRLNRSGLAGSTVSNRYSIDIFRITDMAPSTMATADVGTPKTFSTSVLAPSGLLVEFSKGKNVLPHGLMTIPPKPALTPSTTGGSLVLLATYQFAVVVITRNDAGEEWRSPPSIPATITLTGTQDTVTVDPQLSFLADDNTRNVTIEFYMTKANGSVLQKYKSTTTSYSVAGGTAAANLSDIQLGSGEFLYTQAELSTILTPPFSHIESHGGRAWGIHRDYKNILCPSKTISNGRSPEWANELLLSIVDEEGDLTNIASMDDKLIAFKASAIYVVTGDGLNNGGAGSAHVVTKIDSDVGAIVGSPVVSTGSEVFFVSARGIYMIDRSLQVSFVGAPVDQFLNQPLIQTKETIVGAVFSPATNEVRFQTTNYRLVYDRLRNIWYRDTGAGMQNVVATCMVGTKQALFKSDGTMWIEADHTVVTDNSVAYSSIIRSAWVRPAGTDGRMRLYMARLIMNRTAAGGTPNPTLSIYYDNDDSLLETYTPSAPIAGLVNRISAQPRRHRCSTFSLAILLPSNDQLTRLDAWGAEVGTRPGAFRNNSGAERWV